MGRPQVGTLASDEERRVVSTFANSIAAQISTSMSYLHSTITWAVTAFAGGTGVIIINDNFPNGNSQLLLAVLFLVLAHLFVRTAKAYLNVMRFTALDKWIIVNMEKGNYAACSLAIRKYYVDWVSPLPTRTVLLKTLFELGFAYMWVALIGLFVYASWTNMNNIIWLMVLAHVAAGLEVYFALVRSPYLRRVEPFQIAVEQR